MALYTLEKSSNPKKKYMITIISKKTNRERTIHFGANGMNDYIIYNKTKGNEYANKKKELYINRHESYENFNDLESASFYALKVLWNKPTLQASWNDTKAKLKSKGYIK